MSTSRIIEQLEEGNVAAVLAALKEEEAAFQEWVEQQQMSWEVAREWNSSPELLEEIAW